MLTPGDVLTLAAISAAAALLSGRDRALVGQTPGEVMVQETL